MTETFALTLDDIRNEHFFNALRGGEFCLVLGAGFSYGLKNQYESGFSDELTIPVVEKFISLTNRRFNTNFANSEFEKAADKWKEKIEKQEELFSTFKSLFIVDEINFKNVKSLYSNILVPNWANIYTFNFDNVLDCLIEGLKEEFEVQYYYVGKFSPNNKRNIGYLHNSILKASKVDDLIFTLDTYAKIGNSDNHLYYSIFNDVEYYKKDLVIIGSSFDEQSLYRFLLSRITRKDVRIIHINYSKENKEPYFTSDFRKQAPDIKWINCTAVDFLEFIAENAEQVSKRVILPAFLELVKYPQDDPIIKNPQVQSFGDFLNSRFLKYYSRTAFKQEMRVYKEDEFPGEDDFLRYITIDGYLGLIIHGQGGIGKTRLMLELGNKLLLQGFVVIKVLPDFDKLHEIIEYINLRPNRKYALLFDYIEVQKVFDNVIKWVGNQKSINIRVIGNCRNTFASDVKNDYFGLLKFVDIGFRNKIGIERKLELDYQRAVISSIIDSMLVDAVSDELHWAESMKPFYQTRPSFAAFIKYIHLKNPGGDLSISTNDTFSNWLVKKLKLTIVKQISYPNFFEEKRYVFQLMSCLPANAASARKLEQRVEGSMYLADDINKLIHDGWIDSVNRSLTVVHDTVNDTLLLEFLKNFQFRDFYLVQLLEFALETDSLSSMMWSIQRVWDEVPEEITPSLQNCLATFIDEIFDENIANETWFNQKLRNTHLIGEQERISLFLKHKSLLTEIFGIEKFGSSLAFSMQWLYENILDDTIKANYIGGLRDIYFNKWNIGGRFDDFVENSRGGKIISSYINLFGIDDYIKARFEEYCNNIDFRIGNLESISLAFVSWLNKNGDVTERLRELITLWFEVYKNVRPENVNPSYLLRSCFMRGVSELPIELNVNNLNAIRHVLISRLKSNVGDNLDLKPIVTAWFQIYEKEKPGHVTPVSLVQAWIENGDDFSVVRRIILEILADPIHNAETKAKCIGKWIEKTGDTEFVAPFIGEVLSGDIFYKTAYYIIGHWLEKSDDPIFLKPFLDKWLSDPAEPQMCSFIFQLWLNKGDDPNILIEPIRKWLQTITDPVATGFVLGQFIAADGNVLELKSEIIHWLSCNGSHNQAVSVLGFLLQKLPENSMLPDLEVAVKSVLKSFPALREIGFSIGYWLEKGGNHSIVEPYINGWLRIYGDSEQGATIIRHWLEAGGSCLKVKEFIIPCIKLFDNRKEASTLIFSWVRNGDDPYLVLDCIIEFFQSEVNREYYQSKYLITCWLEKTNMPAPVKIAIKPWLAINGNEADSSIRVCSFWLGKGDEIELVEEYMVTQFKDHSASKASYRVIQLWLQKNGNPESVKLAALTFLKNNWREKQAIDVLKIMIRQKLFLDEVHEYILKIVDMLGFNPFVGLIEINDNKVFLVNAEAKPTDKQAEALGFSIKARLESGQPPDQVKNEVSEFLIKYRLELIVSPVLSGWIEHGNDFDLVAETLLDWLDHNLRHEFESSFVISAALEHEKGFNMVHSKAFEWLTNFGGSYNAKFILSSWLKMKDKERALEIEQWIIYFIENLYQPTKHNWRDDILLTYAYQYKLAI